MGNPIEMYCTLNQSHPLGVGYTSQNLSFVVDSTENYWPIERVNNTAIRLYVEESTVSPDNHYVVTCRLGEKGICTRHVYVGCEYKYPTFHRTMSLNYFDHNCRQTCRSHWLPVYILQLGKAGVYVECSSKSDSNHLHFILRLVHYVTVSESTTQVHWLKTSDRVSGFLSRINNAILKFAWCDAFGNQSGLMCLCLRGWKKLLLISDAR